MKCFSRLVAAGLIVIATAAGMGAPRIASAQMGPNGGPPGNMQRPSQPISRPPAGTRPVKPPPPPARPPKPPPNYYRPPGSNPNGYYSGYRGPRVIVHNPVYVRHPAWGWNRGVIWYPRPIYWGGGFWGPWTIGVSSAIVFGAMINAQNQAVHSYQVAPNSPGATLLTNYQLTQKPCGPPGLVVIYGPDDSVICAQPNHLVHAGTYDLDVQQLSIISR